MVPIKRSQVSDGYIREDLNCLISNREGLGKGLYIMGLGTIDPHSHNVQTKLDKIRKFGVNRPNGKQDTAI